MSRYADDWDGYCDMRWDAQELANDRAREPYECDACFELTDECTCPTLPIDTEETP
jgi:hypothetical protein